MTEDPIKWRNTHLNSISPSFCAAKWYNASIHLGHGYTGSCHLPLPHPIPLEELKHNPSAIHNTEHKKKMRRMMLTGVRPAECSYCWKIEDIGRNNVSDRVYKSTIYSDEDIAKLKNANWKDDILLKTVELSFDRTCNFSCSYCNASYSTSWAKDIKTNGPYQNFMSDGGGAYQADGAWTEPYGKFADKNPYVEAFLQWWPELSTGLEELRVTGGEPTMSHNFWKFAEVVKQHDAPNMRFAVNSNMGMDRETLDRLVQLTHDMPIKDFDLYTSNESYGIQANYIRDGLDYDLWRFNIVHFIENAKFRAITIMMTINSLCLFSITEFLDDMMVLKTKYGHYRPHIDLNILRWPSFMSPLALPDHLKDEVRTKLQAWYDVHKDSALLNGGERAQIKRLIDYIEVVNKGHNSSTGDKKSLHHDFKSFYEQYDKRRGKSFADTFPPSLVKWYNSVKARKVFPMAELVGGKIGHYEDGVYVPQR
jgi:organic radical activating enzyme